MSRGIALLMLGVWTIGGCAGGGGDVPAGAKVVASGAEVVRYEAGEHGRVQVREANGQRVVWEGPVYKGQRVIADAVQGWVTLDGREVVPKAAERGGRTYEMFFKAEEKR